MGSQRWVRRIESAVRFGSHRARIQSHDVVLPTAAHGEVRLRCVAQSDAAQAALLDRLGLVLPKRMRFPETEPSILALSA